MFWLAVIGLALTAAGTIYGIVSNEEGKADAKKVMEKQTLEQQLQAVAQQNAYNKARAATAEAQLGAAKAAAASRPAPPPPNYTPLIVIGGVAFLLLRKK